MSIDLYTHDVFLSYSSKDKTVVRTIAERLRADGLRVWFDDWELKPGDSIPAKIEQGLEQSRVLVLCLSSNAFGSDWAALESGTFRFRDPLNKERRFIPLRLDDAPIKGSLVQFVFIDWREGEQEYQSLFKACRQQVEQMRSEVVAGSKLFLEKDIQLDCGGETIYAYAFRLDGKLVLTGGSSNTVRLYDIETGICLRVFKGHTASVWTVAWSNDQRRILSGGNDRTMRLWDMDTGLCQHIFKGHTGGLHSVVWSADDCSALSVAGDKNMRLWDVKTGHCIKVFEGHTNQVFSVAWSADEDCALSCSEEMYLWDVKTGQPLSVFQRHPKTMFTVAWSSDQRFALSGSADNTVRLWNVETEHCLRVFEGHTDSVRSLAWSRDQRFALSGSTDKTVQLWNIETGDRLFVFEGHESFIRTVTWISDGHRAFSGDTSGGIRIWDLSTFINDEAPKSAIAANTCSINGALDGVSGTFIGRVNSVCS